MASLPTVDEIKQALGIDPADTSKDAALQMNLDATVAIVEGYCSRGLAFADVVEDHEPIDTRNPKLLLYRFPVKAVTAVEVETVPGSDAWSELVGWRVFKRQGVLQWASGCCLPSHYCCGSEPVIRVNYSGGYEDPNWPPDLIDAITRAFYFRWNESAGGSAADVGGPRVKSASVDGLMVSYGDASSAVSGYLSDDAIPPELVNVAAILEPYRARRATGI